MPHGVSTWLNAPLAADDHGVLVGDGVFETVKVTADGPFALERHLARLRRSAAAVGFDHLDEDEEATRHGIATVLSDRTDRPCLLRITWTSGRGPLGSPRGPGPHTVAVAVGPFPDRSSPVAVRLAPWPRNERGLLAGVKSTSYAENAAALDWAHRSGAGEAIFANLGGLLCEGTGTNIAVEYQGRLVTPTLASGCLAGITRELCLETGALGEIDVPAAEVWNTTTEACLMGTSRDVQAIDRLNERQVGAPGPLTSALQDAFAALTTGGVD